MDDISLTEVASKCAARGAVLAERAVKQKPGDPFAKAEIQEAHCWLSVAVLLQKVNLV